MGCNCKKSNEEELEIVESDNLGENNITNFVIRVVSFLISLCFLPLIVIGVIWLLFSHIILTKEIDIVPAVRELGNFVGTLIKKDDEDTNEVFDESDLIVDAIEFKNEST